MLLTFTFPPPSADCCTCLLAHYLDLPLMYVRDLMLTNTPVTVPQVSRDGRADVWVRLWLWVRLVAGVFRPSTARHHPIPPLPPPPTQ